MVNTIPKLRKLGLEILGNVDWGTHFCLFYETKEDLLDILIPYFKAGLENNEYCMWVTSEPLDQKNAEEALRKAVPDFNQYVKKKQIEIIPHTEWHLKDNEFDLKRVLNDWIEKLNDALAQGYEGIRVTGNTGWLEKKDWKDFADYEEEINNMITQYKMMAICTYQLEKCGPFELVDVTRNHQFAVMRREGKWEIFKNMNQVKVEQKLSESEEKWRSLVENSPDHIMYLDRDANILFINHVVPDLPFDEVIGTSFYNYALEEYRETTEACFKKVLETGESSKFESRYKDKEGRVFFFESYVGPVWKSNEIIGLIVRSTDISERKKAELEHTTIIKTALDGFWIHDLKGKFLDVNNSACQMIGYTREELLSMSIPDIEAIEKPEETAQHIKKIIEQGYDRFETCHRHKDGHIINIEASTNYVDIEGGCMFAFIRDITERKNTEQKLKESEEKYRVLVENAQEGIWAIDKNAITTFVNPRMANMLGYTIEEMLGKSLFSFIDDEHKKNAEYYLERRKQGIREQHDFEFPRKNGKKIYAQLETAPILDEKGEFIGGIACVADITEHKEIEQKLMASEEQYYNTINSLRDGLHVIDRDLKLVLINAALEKGLKKLGFSKDIIGRKIVEAFPFLPESVINEYNQVFLSGVPLITEEIAEINNQEVIYEVRKIPIQCEGNISQIVTITRDITERKNHEKVIADLAKFPSENPNPILRIKNNHIIYINSSGEKVLDLFKGERVPERFQEKLKESIETGSLQMLEAEFKDQTYEFTITPIKKEDYVNIYGSNITERKLAEQELIKLNRIKSELIRRMSHELKTPLVAIKGFSNLLIEVYKEKLEENIINIIGEINNGCIRLEKVISDTLKAAELEAGKVDLIKSEDNLTLLIRQCVNDLAGFAKLRNQEIHLDIHDELIAPIVKEQIYQVLSNLLINAIKFTPPNGKIEVRSELRKDFVIISIKDNGIGITKEEKEFLFTQFGKIERYGQGWDIVTEGSGLGLYISKKMVNIHGGDMWVESEGRNMGSTFQFSLPIFTTLSHF